MIEASVDIQIPFHDVDMMEIAWHGHYVKYLEIARCELLDKIDYNYREMRDSGYGWPIIELHIRYAKPLRFQQTVRVVASLSEWENRLKIKYTIFDVDTNTRLTRAHTMQVPIDMSNGEMLFSCPSVLSDKIAKKVAGDEA